MFITLQEMLSRDMNSLNPRNQVSDQEDTRLNLEHDSDDTDGQTDKALRNSGSLFTAVVCC